MAKNNQITENINCCIMGPRIAILQQVRVKRH